MNLRPQNLNTYIGQEAVKPLLKAAINKSNKDGKQFVHTLCFGSPGIGKTTLARVLCNELTGYDWVNLTASKDLTASMLRKILLDLDVRGYGTGGAWKPGAKKYFVFIDEVSELKLSVWESVLYNAMEDFEVRDERGLTYWLPDFTLFAATTAPYSLPPPGLSRFGLKLHLQPYSIKELTDMIVRVYPSMEVKTAKEVANRSRGIARLALNYADGVNDYGLHYFEVADIDERGLTNLDRSYLDALENSGGRPMSLNSIASIVREAPKTLSAFVEPELLRLGLISIGREGRFLQEIGRGAKIR